MYKRIKQIRIDTGMTQKEFGETLGLSRDAYANIENNRVKTNNTFIQLLCSVFSVNENWLRTGNGEVYTKTKKDYIETLGKTYSLDELDKAILDNYLSLSIEKRKIIKEYILSVAKQYNDKNEETKIKALIDKEVEAYRKELESEIKGASKSSISNISNTEEKNKKTS